MREGSRSGAAPFLTAGARREPPRPGPSEAPSPGEAVLLLSRGAAGARGSSFTVGSGPRRSRHKGAPVPAAERRRRLRRARAGSGAARRAPSGASRRAPDKDQIGGRAARGSSGSLPQPHGSPPSLALRQRLAQPPPLHEETSPSRPPLSSREPRHSAESRPGGGHLAYLTGSTVRHSPAVSRHLGRAGRALPYFSLGTRGLPPRPQQLPAGRARRWGQPAGGGAAPKRLRPLRPLPIQLTGPARAGGVGRGAAPRCRELGDREPCGTAGRGRSLARRRREVPGRAPRHGGRLRGWKAARCGGRRFPEPRCPRSLSLCSG